MPARIISIGSELTSGQLLDTNAAWLARRLAAAGIPCERHVTVPDDRAAIATAIAAASVEAELVLITGGLGPTPDDLTRFALADVLGVELRLDRPSLDRIAAFFQQHKRAMMEANRVQALFPVGTTPIENTCGTAPGIRARLNKAEIYVLPGVPGEMQAMFQRHVLPVAVRATGGNVILHHTVHTFGAPESEIGEKLADLMRPGRNPSVGTTAADWVISIRVTAQAAGPDEVRRLIEGDAAEVRRRLGPLVFGELEETLAHAVAKRLTAQGKTVATAESCTGGLIAKRLTDIPGSSNYFVQGFVTYANQAKHRVLDIPVKMIDTHGAVSREVAEVMATHCRRIAATDYALAATGIAGPTGGTADKPVGLVFIALAGPEGATVRQLHLGETLSRDAIRDRAAKAALNLLRLHLIESH